MTDDRRDRARAHFAAGEFRASLELASQVLADAPDDVELLVLAGRAGLEEGTDAVEFTLPVGADWEDYWTGEGYKGGETLRLDCPTDRTPMLLRKGSAVPLNLAPAHFNSTAFERGVRVAPPDVGKIGGGWVEDDGEHIGGPSALWRIEGEADGLGIRLSVNVSGTTDRRVTLVLHASERRPVELSGGRVESERDVGGERLIQGVVG